MTHGGYLGPSTIPEKIQNVKMAAHLLSSSVPADAVADETAVFAGTNFILCGTVPKSKGKRLTQAQVEQIIVNNGGRVKKTIPGARFTKDISHGIQIRWKFNFALTQNSNRVIVTIFFT